MSATGTATNSIQSCCATGAADASSLLAPGQQHRCGWCWQGLHGFLHVVGAWQGTQHWPLLPVAHGNLHPPAGSTEELWQWPEQWPQVAPGPFGGGPVIVCWKLMIGKCEPQRPSRSSLELRVSLKVAELRPYLPGH